MPTSPRLLLAAALLFSAPWLRAHEVASDMFSAASKLLAALDADQKKLATYPLTDKERENWNFVPVVRNGLPMKKMNVDQYALALALVRTGLSHTGMAKANAIMQLEFVLKEAENDKPMANGLRRDPTNYFVTIFGEPSANKSWGWRFEGHHISVNFTVVDGQHVFFAPAFMGSNPAEVRQGPRKGERVLGHEEDLGFALINSLDEAQRKEAVFAEKALTEIVTKNDKRAQLLSPPGISAARFNPAQREKLAAVIKAFIGRARPELAEETFAAIRDAGIEKITFGWAGALQLGQAHYYRIQGPTFLIEFDNSQNNANHIHSTFRDFKGDFGNDLLAEHYAKEHGKTE